MIVNVANKIGQMHGRFFLFLSKKAESHPIWALFLTAWALYEIFEHIALPTIGILWAMGKVSF